MPVTSTAAKYLRHSVVHVLCVCVWGGGCKEIFFLLLYASSANLKMCIQHISYYYCYIIVIIIIIIIVIVVVAVVVVV